VGRDPSAGAEASSSAAALARVLERAKAVGFLGPGPVGDHIAHADRFDRALSDLVARPRPEVEDGPRDEGSPAVAGGPGHAGGVRFADIGSGGGLPGLALLLADGRRRAVLIDASQRRCAFLVWAVAELGVAERAEVWCGRAEAIGHQARARERFDAVVARGFGPPAVTLECATPLVRPGGRIVISEPPVARSWPADGLAELALAQRAGPAGVAVFERLPGLADSYPRPAKQQQQHPCFSLE